jgi:hypothetical protein
MPPKKKLLRNKTAKKKKKKKKQIIWGSLHSPPYLQGHGGPTSGPPHLFHGCGSHPWTSVMSPQRSMPPWSMHGGPTFMLWRFTAMNTSMAMETTFMGVNGHAGIFLAIFL